MNIGLVTIAAFLLLLPGVGFVVGVNFADKNVREIVFRNTPAEIGYVVFVSVVVHLALSCVPSFNFAAVYLNYEDVMRQSHEAQASGALRFALSYFVCSAIVGFLPGFGLGLLVRRVRWRWIFFFVKHRWMMELIPSNPNIIIYARAILKDHNSFSLENIEYPVILEGIVRDCFFDSNGTLLYVVFRNFNFILADGATAPYIEAFQNAGRPPGPSSGDQLVVEGRNVTMMRYFHTPPLPVEAIMAEPVDN